MIIILGSLIGLADMASLYIICEKFPKSDPIQLGFMGGVLFTVIFLIIL